MRVSVAFDGPTVFATLPSESPGAMSAEPMEGGDGAITDLVW